MTLSAFLRPEGLLALLVWCFVVLAAVQLTIRLIMAFSIGLTLRGAIVLAACSLPVAAVYDALAGPHPSFATRLTWAIVPIGLMAVVGFGVGRWVLGLKRLRGQLIAAVMIGLLAPHLFTLAPV